MREFKDLSELLESDKGAMRFYNSMPLGLQQKMYKGGVRTFLTLYESSKASNTQPPEKTTILSSASSNECTGLIPNGSDLSAESWAEHSNLYPFGDPNSSDR